MLRRRHLLYYPLVAGLGCTKPPFQGFLALEECFAKLAIETPVTQGSLLNCWRWALALFGPTSYCGFISVPFGKSYSIIKLISPHRWTLEVTLSDQIPDQTCTYVPLITSPENSLPFISEGIFLLPNSWLLHNG